MSDTTTRGASLPEARAPGRWTLVIVGPGLLFAHKIAAAGALVIGRDASCDVRIDHARVSRRHARLRVGEVCSVEDLGSRNGTTVRVRSIRKGEVETIALGESFALGPFTLVLLAEGTSTTPSSMVVEDPASDTPPAILTKIAKSALPVLIKGETGTGKEVLAETLHRVSKRGGRLLRLNCAGFSAELLESELFGHERGAFTGALATKPGLLEAAAGGTVFLDEIGELPLSLQARLLRAIEAHEIMRVGGTTPVAVDARFIAATNRDLPAEISRGAFRLDLYYRLAVVTLIVPPLRERAARIPGLARELAAAAAERSGQPASRIEAAAIARLQAHAWPGNVRELRNTMERAVLLAGGGTIREEHIGFDAIAGAVAAGATGADLEREGERERILAALASCAGNQTRAAKLLGISRATLVTKLAIHKIPRPQGR